MHAMFIGLPCGHTTQYASHHGAIPAVEEGDALLGRHVLAL